MKHKTSRIAALSLAALLTLLSACRRTPVEVSGADPVESVPPQETSSAPAPAASMPVRTPARLGAMQMAQVFYKPVQAGLVYSVDISGLPSEEVAALRMLQGLAARTQSASVLLDGGTESERFWQNYCTSEYGVVFQRISADELIARYRELIQKLIVYSPEESAGYEYVTARCMAALDSGLAVTPELLERLQRLGVSAEVQDVRGQWENRRAAYSYAAQELLPRCSGHYIALTGADCAFDDYLYAVQGFAFDLDPAVDWEGELLETIVARAEFQRPAVAFGDRPAGQELIDLLSRAGFTYLNVDGFQNTTFFASIPGDTSAYAAGRFSDRKASPGSIYLCFYLAHDSLGGIERAASSLWNSKKVKTPVSMQFSPALFELALPMVNWFLQNRVSTDEIIAAGPGWGEVNEALIPDELYEVWHLTNNYFLKRCGVVTVCADALASPAEDSERSFGQLTSARGVILRPDEAGDPAEEGGVLMNGGVPAVKSVRFSSEKELTEWLETLTPAKDRPLFYAVEIRAELFENRDIYEGLDAAAARMRELRPGVFEFLLAGDLMQTAAAWDAAAKAASSGTADSGAEASGTADSGAEASDTANFDASDTAQSVAP